MFIVLVNGYLQAGIYMNEHFARYAVAATYIPSWEGDLSLVINEVRCVGPLDIEVQGFDMAPIDQEV